MLLRYKRFYRGNNRNASLIIPVEFGHKRIIHTELICWLDVFRFRCSHEKPLSCFAHRQRLQGTDQIFLGNIGFLLDFLVRQFMTIIEQHQHAHLQ